MYALGLFLSKKNIIMGKYYLYTYLQNIIFIEKLFTNRIILGTIKLDKKNIVFIQY